MDRLKYDEMSRKLNDLIECGVLSQKTLFLFGHCNATEALADLLQFHEMIVEAILDNNPSKHGLRYKGIPIISPNDFIKKCSDDAIVLIATRFFEAMNKQLKHLGFNGEVIKLVEYNTYSEYSLSFETIQNKKDRIRHGIEIIDKLKMKHPGYFRIFCPYSSLGDAYYCMCYLSAFLKKRGKDKAVVCVYTENCKDVISIFDGYKIEVLPQFDLEAAIQATIYLQDENGFIAHNDKPYVMNLTKALQIKCISFENLYKCGVFGLQLSEIPAEPISWDLYQNIEVIPESTSVILAPYAGSVTSLNNDIWVNIRDSYKERGYTVFTNTAPGEVPIDGTEAISPKIREMKSVVERAGIFIGLRSGICDVIRTANCRKIALYPDYNFSSTKWKSIDIFKLDGFENVVVYNDDNWEDIKKRINS